MASSNGRSNGDYGEKLVTILQKILGNLITVAPTEYVDDLINIRDTYLRIADRNALMNTLTARVLPHKGMINARDEKYFIDDDKNIFSAISKTYVSKFKNIWKALDAENRQILWKWIDCVVRVLENNYAALKKNA